MPSQKSYRVSGLNNLVVILRQHWGAWNVNPGALEGWSIAGVILLHSLPNLLGNMKDPVMQIALTTYLGQPCLLMGPMFNHFFG